MSPFAADEARSGIRALPTRPEVAFHLKAQKNPQLWAAGSEGVGAQAFWTKPALMALTETHMRLEPPLGSLTLIHCKFGRNKRVVCLVT